MSVCKTASLFTGAVLAMHRHKLHKLSRRRITGIIVACMYVWPSIPNLKLGRLPGTIPEIVCQSSGYRKSFRP